MAKITKQLSSKCDKCGRSEILIRFVGSQFICLRGKTGIFVKPSQWNPNKKELKTSSLESGHAATRKKLADLESFIITTFEEARNTNMKFDSAWLKNTIYEFHNPNMQKAKADLSFEEVYNEFIDKESKLHDWTSATEKKHRTTLNHLLEFDEKISLSKFNDDYLKDYISYLRDGIQMRNTTTEKQLGCVKWFLRWAYKNGYTNNNSCDTFKATFKKPTEPLIVFLHWDELMKVYNFDFSNDVALSKVRDVFCFCCFTSLRHSDVKNLKWENINILERTMSIVTIKTDDAITINLNDYALAILDKYKDGSAGGGLALPVISNQKMNMHLKELGRKCGLDKPVTQTYFIGSQRFEETHPKWDLLTTHCGRRTFICNALALGIPAVVVMKWTGHSDYKAMQPYIDVADKTKAKYMDLFNQVK